MPLQLDPIAAIAQCRVDSESQTATLHDALPIKYPQWCSPKMRALKNWLQVGALPAAALSSWVDGVLAERQLFVGTDRGQPAAAGTVEALPSASTTEKLTTFNPAVDDVNVEYERLSGRGVRFTQAPLEMGEVTTAVLDDTCGNLIQIAQAT